MHRCTQRCARACVCVRVCVAIGAHVLPWLCGAILLLLLFLLFACASSCVFFVCFFRYLRCLALTCARVWGTSHTATLWHDALYVFGGRAAQGRLNDMRRFDLINARWDHLVPEGRPPRACSGRSAVLRDSHDTIYLFGGYDTDGNMHDDVCSFDLRKMPILATLPPVCCIVCLSSTHTSQYFGVIVCVCVCLMVCVCVCLCDGV